MPNARTAKGVSSLVSALLRAGADAISVDEWGLTAEEVAIRGGRDWTAKVFSENRVLLA
jgi:hypothetical protein